MCTISGGSISNSTLLLLALVIVSAFAIFASFNAHAQTPDYITAGVDNESPKWGIEPVTAFGDISSNGFVNCVLLDWGDGSNEILSGSDVRYDISSNTGSWSTSISHVYNNPRLFTIVAMPGAFDIDAPFPCNPYAFSASKTIDVQRHATILSLDPIANLIWEGPLTAMGCLVDSDENKALLSEAITFAGSGVGTLAQPVYTVDDDVLTSPGCYSSTGSSPGQPAASGLTVTAQFAGDSLYLPSDSTTQTYDNLKHSTALVLNDVSDNVIARSRFSLSGGLFDLDMSSIGVEGKTITLEGTGIEFGSMIPALTSNSGSFVGEAAAADKPGETSYARAIFAGDNSYQASRSNIQYYLIQSPLQTVVTINKLSPDSPKWGVDTVTISGTIINPVPGGSLSIDWGDGSPILSGIEIIISGNSWGPVNHQYSKNAVDVNSLHLVVSFYGSSAQPISTDSRPIDVNPHETLLQLGRISDIAIGERLSVTGSIVDKDQPDLPIVNAAITFTGSGASGLQSPVFSDESGLFLSLGMAPSVGRTVKAHFDGTAYYTPSESSETTFSIIQPPPDPWIIYVAIAIAVLGAAVLALHSIEKIPTKQEIHNDYRIQIEVKPGFER